MQIKDKYILHNYKPLIISALRIERILLKFSKKKSSDFYILLFLCVG